MVTLYGLPVVTVDHMVDKVQVKFPRSKKRRIRKKWFKNKANWKVTPQLTVLRLRNVLYMHPARLEQLKKEFEALKKES